MSMHSRMTTAQLFARFAGDSFQNWKLANGQRVTHRKYGQGKVAIVGLDPDRQLRIQISFDKDPDGRRHRQFKPKVFANPRSILDMTLPENLVIVERAVGHPHIKRRVEYSPALGRVPRETRCWACHAELIEYSPDITPHGFRNCSTCGWITCDCGACRSPLNWQGGCNGQIERLGQDKYEERVQERFGHATSNKQTSIRAFDSGDDDDEWAHSLIYATPD